MKKMSYILFLTIAITNLSAHPSLQAKEHVHILNQRKLIVKILLEQKMA